VGAVEGLVPGERVVFGVEAESEGAAVAESFFLGHSAIEPSAAWAMAVRKVDD
jgi:hypothetical protein